MTEDEAKVYVSEDGESLYVLHGETPVHIVPGLSLRLFSDSFALRYATEWVVSAHPKDDGTVEWDNGGAPNEVFRVDGNVGYIKALGYTEA